MKRLFTSLSGYLLMTCYIFSQEPVSKLPELNVLMGSWEISAETRLSANGPWEINKGKSIISKTTGTALIEEEYTGILQNKSYHTKSFIAFDHFKDRFQRVFIDSEHGVLIDYEGEKRNDTIIFDKNWIYPTKNTVELRVIYTFISPDEFTIENMRMPGNASVWDVTGRMRYRRIK